MFDNDDTITRDARTSAVPGNRWSRLARLGSLATGVAGNMLTEGARQFAQGKLARAFGQHVSGHPRRD